MFVELIEKEKKEEFIKNYVLELNKKKHPYWELENELESRFDDTYKLDIPRQESELTKYFSNLEEENIFVKFYYYIDRDMCHNYSNNRALIFSFGDTFIKIFDKKVGSSDHFSLYARKCKDFIEENKQKIIINNPLSIKDNYVKDFIIPNISQNEKEEYKNYLNGILKKREEFIQDKIKKERKGLLDLFK